MEQKIDKLKGHTDQLLGCYLGLLRKSHLVWVIFDKQEVRDEFGRGSRSHGFEVLFYALFHSCVTDLTNLAFDKYPSTPSVAKLMAEIQDPDVLAALRAAYSTYVVEREEGLDAEWHKTLDAMDERRREELRQEFDEIVGRVRKGWDEFQSQPWVPGFQVIRDKITAHLELRLGEGGYELAGPKLVKIKFASLREAMRLLERLVIDLNRIVRGAGFAIEEADRQFQDQASAFWTGKP